MKDIEKKLQDLQDEFFTEIKFIGDQVGIDMPEPSEIDLLQEHVRNPLELMEEYKKSKGLKTDDTMVEMLQHIFEDMVPMINKMPGGSEYRNELLDIVTEACNVNPEDIHINDICREMENCAAQITDL